MRKGRKRGKLGQQHHGRETSTQTEETDRREKAGGRESLAVQYSLHSVSLVSVALATRQRAAWSWSLRDSVSNTLTPLSLLSSFFCCWFSLFLFRLYYIIFYFIWNGFIRRVLLWLWFYWFADIVCFINSLGLSVFSTCDRMDVVYD